MIATLLPRKIKKKAKKYHAEHVKKVEACFFGDKKLTRAEVKALLKSRYLHFNFNNTKEGYSFWYKWYKKTWYEKKTV
jgi:hypothetical protein